MEDYRRERWFTLPDSGGHTWTVWLSSYHWCPELHPYDAVGVTIFDTREIYIDVWPYQWEQNETMHHETVHMNLNRAGRHKTARSEEHFVRRLSPPHYRMAERFGMRWPDRPAAYQSMARAARRLHLIKYPETA